MVLGFVLAWRVGVVLIDAPEFSLYLLTRFWGFDGNKDFLLVQRWPRALAAAIAALRLLLFAVLAAILVAVLMVSSAAASELGATPALPSKVRLVHPLYIAK